VAIGKSLIDRRDQRWGLHRRDQVVEEALFGRFEGGTGRRLGLRIERALAARDIGCLQRGIEIVVNHLERARIGIVDADLIGGELVLDQLIFDAVV